MNTKEQDKNLLGIGACAGKLMPEFPLGDAVRIPINRMNFIMITAGSGTVDVDGKSYGLHKGSFLYLLPNHLLALRSCSENFRTRYAGFTFDLLSDFPLLLKADTTDYVGDYPCHELDNRDYLVMQKYYGLLIDRYQSEEAGMEVIKGILFSFVQEVNRIYSGRNIEVHMTHRDKLADGFFKLLHRHFIEERTAAFYAEKLYISDKHLMRLIKQETGHTFHFWLSDLLLRQAKLLLLSTDQNVTQIADSMCFPNSSAFARFFRKGVGMSPLEYRRQYLK